MDTIFTQAQIDIAIAAGAAVAVTATILVLAWPYLFPDVTAARLKRIREERQKLRERDQARMTAPRGGLVEAPKKFYTRIVESLRLDAGDEEGEIANRLRMAGFRGKSPIYAYLAARALVPFATLAVAALYIYVIMAAPPALAAQIAILAGAAGAGHYAPRVYVKNRIDKRRKAILRAWPDALDLLLICVESGMTVETALRKVADEISVQSIELAEELSLTVAELSYSQNRKQAYENLGARTGSYSVRAVATGMMQSDKYGTSLSKLLRVLSQEQREQRMQDAEKKASALPPKLTVPMILFFLPVLFIVILAPAVIEVMGL